MHVPPFKHGDEAHKLVTVVGFAPVVVTVVGIVLVVVTPFLINISSVKNFKRLRSKANTHNNGFAF